MNDRHKVKMVCLEHGFCFMFQCFCDFSKAKRAHS